MATPNTSSQTAPTPPAKSAMATKPATVIKPVTKPATAPTPPAKPAMATKSVTVAKPATLTKSVTVAKPARVAKPVTVAKPATVAKPVTVTKPAIEPKGTTAAKPVTKPATVTKPVTKPATVTKPVNAIRPVVELTELAQKSQEQLVSGLTQGQQLSVDAVQVWVKAVTTLPVMNLPATPGFPAMPDLDAATRYAFDLAVDLMSVQRRFALQLTRMLPGKTA